MKKLVFGLLILALAGGAFFGVRTIDRMALQYITGQRRAPGEDFFGDPVSDDGPVPGFAFLGFTRPSDDPAGMRIVRARDTAREIGLREGDVVTSVEGKTFRSSQALMKFFLGNCRAGQTVSLTVVRGSDPPFDVRMTLEAFIRHPGDLGLRYENVEIQSDSGHRLRGWFIPPPDRSDGRLVVFVHGANASRFQALEHGGKYWTRRGYGFLAMDLSGRGSSEGKYITYTVDEREDVRSMLRWARNHPPIDPGKVVLFGTSNGAASSIFAAAGDEELPALVLDAPYADLWDAAGAMLRSRGVDPILRYPLALAVRFRTGVDLRAIHPIDVITQVKAPVLFVHGDADTQVPVTHSERMHEARIRAGLPSEIWILPGGEHGFDNYPPEGVFWNRILDFFDRALGGPPVSWQLAS